MKQKLTIPGNIKVRATKNGWMTKEELNWFSSSFWLEYVVGTTCLSHDHHVLLILDSYKPHKATEVLNNLEEGGTDVSYIPGGCTVHHWFSRWMYQ